MHLCPKDLPPSPTPPPTTRIRAQDVRQRLPRKRICSARMRVPARDPSEGDVLFTCNRVSHGNAPGDHEERGRIRSREGKIVVYTFVWYDESVKEVWRQDASK